MCNTFSGNIFIDFLPSFPLPIPSRCGPFSSWSFPGEPPYAVTPVTAATAPRKKGGDRERSPPLIS